MRVEISITAGPAKGQRFTFEKPDRFLFGRALDARVSLPNDPYVSRQHFLLEISPPECKVTDLDSKNGTFVNGVRYGGRKPPDPEVQQAPNDVKDIKLNDGDKITVGDTQMHVIIVPSPENAKKDDTAAATLSYAQVAPHNEESSSTPREALGKFLKQAAVRKPPGDAPLPPSHKTPSDMPTIEGYQIEDIIDRGGMGIVYKATVLNTGHLVAIKVMLPQMATNPDNINAFQREIDLTRQLQHPHIAQLFDHGNAGDLFYFVLEYVPGMNLHQFLKFRGGRLHLGEAAMIMLETLEGLAYAHHAQVTMTIADGNTQIYKGVVHRDLKPQNLLLGYTENRWIVKISDFGISKSYESAGFTNITKPGEVLGTPMYWPREQITHYKYLNPATDVFSIAAVFYEVLTGQWVRDGFEALFERCKKQKRVAAISDYMSVIVSNPAIPIRQRNAEIPEPVANVLDRALLEAEVPYDEHKMREALAQLRYPDASAFRDALIQAFQEVGLTEERLQEDQLRLGARDKEFMSVAPIRPKGQRGQEGQGDDPEQPRDEARSASEGSIFYSIMQPSSRSKEVALLVFDLEEPSKYLREGGDTYFSGIISRIYKRARKHSSASALMFMKSTGDGFLAVFSSTSSAFSLGLSFLKRPIQPDIQVRMAIHWGSVKIAHDGDVLGTEVHRVFRTKHVQMHDQLDPGDDSVPMPVTDRIVVTEQALERLEAIDRAKFRYAGKYRLKGFVDEYNLWVLHKRS